MLSTYQTKANPHVKSRVQVKICGIMRAEHAQLAARCGAEMIGMVFAESRRRISIETAQSIRAALGTRSAKPSLVGVFVNETPEHILDIARKVNLDIVQLSGDETPETVVECARHLLVIKALRFPKGTSHNEALAMLDAYAPYKLGSRLRFLVDAYHPIEYGGTGQVADWSLAAHIASRYEVILAGGISPSNVQTALRQVSPWGIDVSSGVERDGAKDPQLIQEFIAATRMSS